jgi:hypothetical protein
MNTALSVLALGLLVASVCCVAGGCAPSATERFKGNPLFDPDFVPICVGGQNVSRAHIYHDAGINLYHSIDDVSLTPASATDQKPSAEILKVLSDLGMYAIVDQATWFAFRDNPTIVAWTCPVDEPDNKGDDGRPMPLEEFLAVSKKFRKADPGRPYVVCFGQGVTNDGFGGRGIERSEYPKYLAAVDFIDYDFYPIANFKWGRGLPKADPSDMELLRKDGQWHLDMVGQGVSRLRHWTDNQKPVLVWIETSHNHNPDPTRIATPAQTNCEVWDAMVHGARGVGYFSHDFTVPREVGQSWTLARNKPMLAQLKKTNAKLMKLARVIAAPLASEPAQATCEGGGQVVYSTKQVDGATAVLSVNVFAEPARATLWVVGLRKGTNVEVLEEGRTLEAAADGRFVDEFGPYQEHVYRIRG